MWVDRKDGDCTVFPSPLGLKILEAQHHRGRLAKPTPFAWKHTARSGLGELLAKAALLLKSVP